MRDIALTEVMEGARIQTKDGEYNLFRKYILCFSLMHSLGHKRKYTKVNKGHKLSCFPKVKMSDLESLKDIIGSFCVFLIRIQVN